jgi:hypothetical protein
MKSLSECNSYYKYDAHRNDEQPESGISPKDATAVRFVQKITINKFFEFLQKYCQEKCIFGSDFTIRCIGGNSESIGLDCIRMLSARDVLRFPLDNAD